ncbi:hypothetical protein EXM76_03230 [Clostridium botulinum]|nr:hypothetical protein [Clostridium botulinum]
MKKIMTFIMATVLTLGIFMIPKQVSASENKEVVAYRISMPVNYNTLDTSKIKSATLHYGVNGWKDVKDIQLNRSIVDYYMGKTFESFYTTIYVEKGSKIDYCFKQEFYEEGTKWDNNNNEDYHIVVIESNVK